MVAQIVQPSSNGRKEFLAKAHKVTPLPPSLMYIFHGRGSVLKRHLRAVNAPKRHRSMLFIQTS